MDFAEGRSHPILRGPISPRRPAPAIGKILLGQPISFKVVTPLLLAVFFLLFLTATTTSVTESSTLSGTVSFQSSQSNKKEVPVAFFDATPTGLKTIRIGMPTAIEVAAFPKETFGMLPASISDVEHQATVHDGIPHYRVTAILDADHFISGSHTLFLSDETTIKTIVQTKKQFLLEWIKYAFASSLYYDHR